MKHNKLIRDKIPEIIHSQGKQAVTRELTSEEYGRALLEKLNEETQEFLNSGEVEELADLLEVIYAIANQQGVMVNELEAIRETKREAVGGFEGRIWLESVTS